MSNETKREVFERALTEWYDLVCDVGAQGNEAYGYCEFDVTISKYKKDYDAALPDDLPVIPKAVGEYLKNKKENNEPLGKVLWRLGCIGVGILSPVEMFVLDHAEDFASAYLLGVWRVEETGEIVKLEEEK